LTSTGYSVVGIDASPSMLRIARTVAPRARFERGAIGSVRLPTCDAVISVGEGIGYLPPAARRPPSLRPLFAKVARALRPGGLFIFDLLVDEGSRPPSYRTWHAGDDWAVLVDAQQQSGILVRRITTFRARKGGYRQSEERHVAGVFRRLDVLRWMGAEGFSARTRRRYGSAAPLLPGRLAFIARLRK
jgi:SAM-dependent methyltransferase